MDATKDTKGADVLFINLGIGGHVALHGARFEHVRHGDSLLAPARAVVLRLSRVRLEREQAAVAELLSILDDFTKAHGLLSQPLVSCFALCAAASTLLRRMGGHAFGSGTEAATARALDSARQLLPSINLLPFQRRRKRHRAPKVVVPALLDALSALVEEEVASQRHGSGGQDASTQHGTAASASAAASSVASSPAQGEQGDKGEQGGQGGEAATREGQAKEGRGKGGGGAMSASDFDEEELVLLDLLHAPPDSYLHHLASVMARIETLSHVLAWATYDDRHPLGRGDAISQAELRIVSLPRLKLTFQALRVGGSVSLYSIDHADLYITLPLPLPLTRCASTRSTMPTCTSLTSAMRPRLCYRVSPTPYSSPTLTGR